MDVVFPIQAITCNLGFIYIWCSFFSLQPISASINSFTHVIIHVRRNPTLCSVPPPAVIVSKLSTCYYCVAVICILQNGLQALFEAESHMLMLWLVESKYYNILSPTCGKGRSWRIKYLLGPKKPKKKIIGKNKSSTDSF